MSWLEVKSFHLSRDEMVEPDFEIKTVVDEVLDGIEFREKRARTMDIDDFMKLLHAFNSKGIHFI